MTLRLVGGVVLLNLAFLAIGYCLLAATLRRASPRTVASYAGIALLAGAGMWGVVLCVVAALGGRTGAVEFTTSAILLAAAGLAAVPVVGQRLAVSRTPTSRPLRPWQDVVATACCAGLVVIGVFALVGGFRSSPWLDDTWKLFVPKGLILEYHGLLPDVWRRFSSADSPLWWSVVTSLDLRFAGRNLHAVNAQLAILVLAFLAALARMLWGYVRPYVLWPSLLLVAAMPELFRQAQGGGADVLLGAFLSLFCLGALGWLVRRDPRALLAAAVFGAVAVQVKNEGAPQLVILAGLLSLLLFRSGIRAVLRLGGAVVAALALEVPWYVWRSAHGIHGDFVLSRALNVSYLSSRTARIGPSLHTLGHDLLGPRQWLVTVPLAVVLALWVALRARRPFWLVVPVLVGVDYLFWVWVNWSDPLDLGYRLSTSGYRVIDTTVLLAAAFIPLLAEAVLRLEVEQERGQLLDARAAGEPVVQLGREGRPLEGA